MSVGYQMAGLVALVGLLVSSCGESDGAWTTIDSREEVVTTENDAIVMFDTGPVDHCELTLERDRREDLEPITHRLEPDLITFYSGVSSSKYIFSDCIGVRYTTDRDAIADAEYERNVETDGKCIADLRRESARSLPDDPTEEELDEWLDRIELGEVECRRQAGE